MVKIIWLGIFLILLVGIMLCLLLFFNINHWPVVNLKFVRLAGHFQLACIQDLLLILALLDVVVVGIGFG